MPKDTLFFGNKRLIKFCTVPYKGQHEFLFKKITDNSDPDFGYYRYDSKAGKDSLGYVKVKDATADSPEIGKFTVGTGDQKGDLKNGKGFFPLVTQKPSRGQNFGYGAKFSINFTMSADGHAIERDSDGMVIMDPDNPTVPKAGLPINFKFSGDDDVWVFIDDQLILDVGGAHGAVEGNICFSLNGDDDYSYPYAKTKYVKDAADYYNHDQKVGWTNGSPVNLTSVFNTIGLYSDSSKQHTLTVYYIERGSLESNCRITFNFQISDMLTVRNTLSLGDVNPELSDLTEQVAGTEAVEYLMASDSPTSAVTSPEYDVPPLLLYINANNPADRPNDVNYQYHNYGAMHIKDAYAASDMLEITGRDYAGYGQSDSDPNDTTDARIGRFINLTKESKSKEDGGFHTNVEVRVFREGGYEQIRHPKGDLKTNIYPNGGKAGWYTSVSTDYAEVKGTDLYFYDVEGYYVWKICSKYSALDRYTKKANPNDSDDISHAAMPSYTLKTNYPTSGTNYTLENWINDYYSLYNKLKKWAENNANCEDATKRAAYAKAVKAYMDLQPKSANTPSDVEDEFDNKCNQTTEYQYDTDTIDFYIYAMNAPTVQSDNSYNPLASGQSNVQSYTVTPYTPSTASLPTGESTGGSYYKVSGVPKYVKKVVTDSVNPSNNSTTDCPNVISISVGGIVKQIEATQMVIDDPPLDSNSDPICAYEPCFHYTSQKIKHIGDDTSYSYTNPVVVWFYGATTPTVTVTTVKGEKTLELHQDGSLPYYYARIYKKSSKTQGGNTTNMDNTFKYNGTAFTIPSDTALESMPAPCLFLEGSGSNLTPNWYNLLTLVVNPISGWNAYRLYVWGAGPLNIDGSWNDAYNMAESDELYYFHTPSVANSRYIIRDNGSNQTNAGDIGDNPAGLLGRGGTVGGGASDTDKDYNGYQSATQAEQSFLFHIDQCNANQPMFGTYNDTTYSSYAPTYNNFSTVEYISFGPDDFANGVNRKSVILRVDAAFSYVVREMTDWSWKYDLNNVTVTDEGTYTGYDGENKVGRNLVITDDVYGKMAQVDTFASDYSYTDSSNQTVTLHNTAEVTFINHKADDSRKDVEGDVAAADNSCPVGDHVQPTGGTGLWAAN